MFDILVVSYLFLGGAGFGALVVLSVLELLTAFGRVDISDHILGNGWMLTLCCMCLGAVCLYFDLGRPDRVLYLLFSPEFTAITVGAYMVVVAIVLTAMFMIMEKTKRLDFPVAVWIAIACSACIVGVIGSCYTGVLLQVLAAVLAWQTPLIPALFMLSSFSAGCAIVILAVTFSDETSSVEQLASSIIRFDAAIISLELVVLAAFLAWLSFSDATVVCVQAALVGKLAGPFWLMLLIGLIAPLVVERIPLFNDNRTKATVVSVMILIGCFVLRWCIVGLSEFDSTQISGAMYGMGLYGN